MKNLLSWLAIGALAFAVTLIFFGARPADLLHIPVEILHNVLSKKSETAGNAEPSPNPSPSVAQPPVIQPPPSPPQAAQPAVAEATPEPSATSSVAPTPVEATVDLAALSNTPNEWPKAVELKEAVEFPAVLNGKVVGKVKVPPGVHAHLLLVRGGKVGVEYQGGGAMVDVSETDLIEQVLAARHR